MLSTREVRSLAIKRIFPFFIKQIDICDLWAAMKKKYTLSTWRKNIDQKWKTFPNKTNYWQKKHWNLFENAKSLFFHNFVYFGLATVKQILPLNGYHVEWYCGFSLDSTNKWNVVFFLNLYEMWNAERRLVLPQSILLFRQTMENSTKYEPLHPYMYVCIVYWEFMVEL